MSDPPPGKSKRGRRTRDEIDHIKNQIVDFVTQNRPCTVRQVFYGLVTRGVVEKTEQQYKGTVGRLLSVLRLRRVIPFGAITDGTRWMHKSDSHSSLGSFLEDASSIYRRDLWESQDVAVEVWLEKDALAGVLVKATNPWDVPLMPTRGYPSLSYLYEAAEDIESSGKTTYVYYFGDYDPSGVDIARNVEKRLREFAPNAHIVFERVAVTPQQIKSMKLPTRPTKKTDTRSRNFRGRSVELDAIPPPTLRKMAEDCILRHVDQRAARVVRVAEESERGLLLKLAQKRSLLTMVNKRAARTSA